LPEVSSQFPEYTPLTGPREAGMRLWWHGGAHNIPAHHAYILCRGMRLGIIYAFPMVRSQRL